MMYLFLVKTPETVTDARLCKWVLRIRLKMFLFVCLLMLNVQYLTCNPAEKWLLPMFFLFIYFPPFLPSGASSIENHRNFQKSQMSDQVTECFSN